MSLRNDLNRGDRVKPITEVITATHFTDNTVMIVRKLSRARRCRYCDAVLPLATEAAANAAGALCLEHVERR